MWSVDQRILISFATTQIHVLILQVHYNSVYPLGEAPHTYSYKDDSKILGSKKIGRMLSAFG